MNIQAEQPNSDYPDYPCCERVHRVEAVPGDATTLLGGFCPVHGITHSKVVKKVCQACEMDKHDHCSGQVKAMGSPCYCIHCWGSGGSPAAHAINTSHFSRKSHGKSILQDWVTHLGLRHQGVLLTAVRGCDTAPKNDASKLLTRFYRGMILQAHCGDNQKASSFIAVPKNADELHNAFDAFRTNCDHYPNHYLMHFIHAAEIVGYKHPIKVWMYAWNSFYVQMCNALHMNPESEDFLDMRLDASEEVFSQRDHSCDGSFMKK